MGHLFSKAKRETWRKEGENRKYAGGSRCVIRRNGPLLNGIHGPQQNPTTTLFCVFLALVTQALLYDLIQRPDQRPAWATRSDATLQLGEQILPRLALPPGIEHRSQTLAVRSQCSEEALVRLGAVQQLAKSRCVAYAEVPAVI